MATEMQIEANRTNALRSTGPRTPEGKSVASMNATRHGLTSKQVLVAGEDEEVFRAFKDKLREDLQPVGALEESLVELSGDNLWRLHRVRRVEADLLTPSAPGGEGSLTSSSTSGNPSSNLGWTFLVRERAIATLQRYESSLTRGLYRALHELERLRARRAGEVVPLPMAVDVGSLFGDDVPRSTDGE